jgi:hypothetical protein
MMPHTLCALNYKSSGLGSFRDDFNNFSKSEGRFAHGGLVFCHEQFL